MHVHPLCKCSDQANAWYSFMWQQSLRRAARDLHSGNSHSEEQPVISVQSLDCPPIQDISVWIEKYSVMANLLASCFPEKAPKLFTYQASIVRAECNFDDRRWITYNHCYRREALSPQKSGLVSPNPPSLQRGLH